MRDDRPPGDPRNNPEERKAWEQHGWVIEREDRDLEDPREWLVDPDAAASRRAATAERGAPAPGGIRFLDIPYEPEESARTKAYVRWKRLNQAAMDTRDRERFGLNRSALPRRQGR